MRGAMHGIHVDSGNDIEASELEPKAHASGSGEQVNTNGSHNGS